MVSDAEIHLVSANQVRSEALTWPERARAVVIRDDASYTGAAELLKGIKALRGRIAETFDPHIKRAHEAHKALVRDKTETEAPLTEAEGVLKQTLVTYQQEQEAIRRAEARRLEDAARQAEETRRLEEAAALERVAADTGDESMRATAHEVLDAPMPTMAVPVARATPKVAGISYRETYSGRVVSVPKLIAFVGRNPQFSNLLTPNMTAINQLARAHKDMLQIDGIEVVKERIAAASGR
ncbi:MAG: hypothetical protein M3Q55_14485 [Acidobacteriota bacterium]|nr:hypothetical protein [Acidobacteriota bacterium]